MKESKPRAAQQDTEFSLTAVPESERKSYISLTIIWTGFVFVIVSMMAGGTLAVGLSFKEVIYATLIGNVFLCIIAVAVSVIASKTGLTFALLTRYSFGVMGSKVASIFVPIVNIGWYTIQAATYGHFVATALGMGEVGEAICMVLSAIAMGAFAFYGVKAITILGYVAIPAIVFLSIATTIRSMGVLGSWEALMAYRPSAPMTLAAGVTTVIGAWILSTATCIADIMRYARSTKEAVASALTGLLFGNILMIVCGAIATIATMCSSIIHIITSKLCETSLPTICFYCSRRIRQRCLPAIITTVNVSSRRYSIASSSRTNGNRYLTVVVC